MQIKKKVIIVLITLVVALGGFLAVFFVYLPVKSVKVESVKLLSDERTKRDYEKIVERKDKIKKDPQDIVQYTGLAFSWKSIGDTLNDKKYYKKALEWALEGLDRSPRHAILNMNTGNLYRELSEYEKAEKYYRKAIESAPGDPQMYLALIDLYKYNLKKPEAEIVKVYQDGLARLINTLPLLNSFAAYLRDTGQRERAFDFYKELAKAVPDNQAYKQTIIELEKEIARGE